MEGTIGIESINAVFACIGPCRFVSVDDFLIYAVLPFSLRPRPASQSALEHARGLLSTQVMVFIGDGGIMWNFLSL